MLHTQPFHFIFIFMFVCEMTIGHRHFKQHKTDIHSPSNGGLYSKLDPPVLQYVTQQAN